MDSPQESLRVDDLTWAALLGRWLDFARASVALPADADGQRWKASVAPVITLQAITFALSQLNDLPEDERALGLDRAEILLRQESGNLNTTWRGEPMAPAVLELMSDAARALRAATLGCCVELLVTGAASPREMPDHRALLAAVDPTSFNGSMYMVWPGTLAVDGELIGFLIGPSPRDWWRRQTDAAEAVQRSLGQLVEMFSPVRVRYAMSPRQVYRQVDGEGRIIEDVAAMLTDDPRSGQPLLHCVWDAGVAKPPTVDAKRWAGQQRAAWPNNGIFFRAEVEQGAAPPTAC